MQEGRWQKKEQHMLFEDFVPDTFATDFKTCEQPLIETPSNVEWICTCLLLPGVRNDDLEVKYGPRQ